MDMDLSVIFAHYLNSYLSPYDLLYPILFNVDF